MSGNGRPTVDVCALDELEEGKIVEVSVGRRRAGAVRVGGRVFVFGERCPHHGGPLCKGRLIFPLTAERPGEPRVARETPAVVCPWHGWEFRLDNGRALADGRVRAKVYDVEVAGSQVLVRSGSDG